MECRRSARRDAHEQNSIPSLFRPGRIMAPMSSDCASGLTTASGVHRVGVLRLLMCSDGTTKAKKPTDQKYIRDQFTKFLCIYLLWGVMSRVLFTRQLSVQHVDSNLGASSHLGYPTSARTDPWFCNSHATERV